MGLLFIFNNDNLLKQMDITQKNDKNRSSLLNIAIIIKQVTKGKK